MTNQLCSNIIAQLMATTASVMQLHTRLRQEGSPDADPTTTGGSGAGGRQKSMMLKELENAVIMTQSMLTKVTANRYVWFSNVNIDLLFELKMIYNL